MSPDKDIIALAYTEAKEQLVNSLENNDFLLNKTQSMIRFLIVVQTFLSGGFISMYTSISLDIKMFFVVSVTGFLLATLVCILNLKSLNIPLKGVRSSSLFQLKKEYTANDVKLKICETVDKKIDMVKEINSSLGKKLDLSLKITVMIPVLIMFLKILLSILSITS